MKVLAHLRKWGAVYSLLITTLTGAIILKDYFAPPRAQVELWQVGGATPIFDKDTAIYLSSEATALPNLYAGNLTYLNTGDITVTNLRDTRRASNPDSIVAIKADSEKVDRSQIKASVIKGTLAIDIEFLKPGESVSISVISRKPVSLSGEFRLLNADARIVDPIKQVSSQGRLAKILLAILFALVAVQSYVLLLATRKRPDVIDGGTF